MSRERGEARATDISVGADTSGQIIRLPLPRSDRIDRWFTIVEAKFESARIVKDEETYKAIISNLGWRTLDLIDDIIENPPPIGLYEDLRAELIRRLSDSDGTRIQRLVEAQDLGDRTSSHVDHVEESPSRYYEGDPGSIEDQRPKQTHGDGRPHP
jgi:hypothetical protein